MTTWKPQYQHQQFGTWYDMYLETDAIEIMPGGKIQATGTDEVGEFTFNGAFSPHDTTFKFIKNYIGRHTIHYEGIFDKKKFQFEGFWGYYLGSHDGEFRMKKV